MGEATPLEIGVLGPLTAWRDGQRLDLGPYRQRAVLAVLAIHANSVVSVDRLIDQVWSGNPPASAAGTVQAYVSNLRRVVEPGRAGRAASMIVTEAPGYALRVESAQLDCSLFEELRSAARSRAADPAEALGLVERALRLWRGRALAEFEDEAFAVAWRARLEELHADTVELHVELLLELGRTGEAAAELTGAVVTWPVRERFRAQLVVALVRQGRQAEALRAYEAARRYLADELGLSPGPELESAYRQALAADTATTNGGAARVPAAEPASARSNASGPLDVAAADGNLPNALSSFVGRRADLAQLTAELPAQRLLTLTGPGGVGKTRLALEAAHRAHAHFSDGVWLCELGVIARGEDVAYAVAEVLRARPQEGQSTLDAVVDHLRGRRVLLVVDNCEHVLDAAADVVVTITRACPTLTVLATSREPLMVQGERVWTLGGLDLAIDAPALFRDRAGAATSPGASDTADDDSIIEHLCTHLDGMPLAIELAAARARSMTLTDLASRLDDRFRLLRGRARDRPDRHQTLLAAIEWSYRLLDDTERAVFDQLSVFPGSFEPSAAAAVCDAAPPGPGVIEDILHQLADKSVVVVDRSEAHTRFGLLETLRHYGASHRSEEAHRQLQRRFVRHWVDEARRFAGLLEGAASAQGRASFRREWHNLRAAVQFAIAERDQSRLVELLDAVHWYAEAAGIVEVGSWAEAAVACVGDHPSLLGTAAFYSHMRGDSGKAKSLAEAGIEAAAHDDPATRLCWQALQLVHWYGGNPRAAIDAQSHVIRLTDAEREPYAAAFAYAVAGGTSAVAGRSDGAQWLAASSAAASSLHNDTLEMWQTFMSAAHAFGEGRLDDAFHGFHDAAAQAAACDAPIWETRALQIQATAAVALGRHDAGRVVYETLRRVHDMRSWSDVDGALQLVIGLCLQQRRLEDAAVVLGYVDAHDLHHSLTAPRRDALFDRIYSDGDLDGARRRGEAMSRDDVVGYVLARLSATVP